MPHPRTVRVAVIQAGSEMYDLEAGLRKAERLASDAASQGAGLVLFPEAFLTGYPKGEDFGARVGSRSPEGRALFRRYFESAMDVPGPAATRLGELAQKIRAWVVIGVIERAGGTLYCSILFFGPDGKLAAKHRKLMPTAMERLIWGFGDGSTLPVLETNIGRVGAVICWENYMPLLRAAMYAKGIQIYCAPTVDDRERWVATMRHIALEGRCFVLSACQYLQLETAVIRGGSLIVNPHGELIVGPVYGAEQILTADLDLGSISEGTFDFDVSGHYARPDVFRLEVNQTPSVPVLFRGGPE